jgi:hypothetical protein
MKEDRMQGSVVQESSAIVPGDQLADTVDQGGSQCSDCGDELVFCRCKPGEA